MAPRFLLSKHQRQKVSNEIYSLAFNGTAIQTQLKKQKKEEKWDKMNKQTIFCASEASYKKLHIILA